MVKIAIVVIPEAFPHSIIEPFDFFTRSKAIYTKRTGQNISADSTVDLIGEDKSIPISFGGINIQLTEDVTSKEQYDIVWIPSLTIDPDLSYKRRKNVIHWIRKQKEFGAEIASICTGSFLLAETGVLNHQSTTLHWHFLDQFSKLYPLIFTKPQLPMYYGNGVYSAAADTEWFSVAKEVLEKQHGKTFSTKTAEMLSFNGLRSNTPSSPSAKVLNNTHDAIVVKTQTWLAEHISEANLISRAAIEFGLSESSLTRRFKSAHKVSLINFIQTLRIDRAKDALELTNMPIEQISDLVGYRDSSYFRRLFKVKTGMTPKEYRKSYAA